MAFLAGPSFHEGRSWAVATVVANPSATATSLTSATLEFNFISFTSLVNAGCVRYEIDSVGICSFIALLVPGESLRLKILQFLQHPRCLEGIVVDVAGVQ